MTREQIIENVMRELRAGATKLEKAQAKFNETAATDPGYAIQWYADDLAAAQEYERLCRTALEGIAEGGDAIEVVRGLSDWIRDQLVEPHSWSPSSTSPLANVVKFHQASARSEWLGKFKWPLASAEGLSDRQAELECEIVDRERRRPHAPAHAVLPKLATSSVLRRALAKDDPELLAELDDALGFGAGAVAEMAEAEARRREEARQAKWDEERKAREEREARRCQEKISYQRGCYRNATKTVSDRDGKTMRVCSQHAKCKENFGWKVIEEATV